MGSPGARLGTALASGSDSKRTRPGDRRTPPRYEYRVTWRRRSWSPTTYSNTRTIQRVEAVHRFIAKLEAFDGADVLKVRVDRREVGPWAPCEVQP